MTDRERLLRSAGYHLIYAQNSLRLALPLMERDNAHKDYLGSIAR